MNKDRFLNSAGPYFFLLLVATILLWPVIAKHDSFLLGFENRHMAYSYMVKLNYALHHGYFPMWDANSFGGKCFPGEFQPGIFYPLNILMCFLFGTADGIDPYYIDLLVVLHFYVALFGMYKVCRLFKLPAIAAIGAALIYAFTGSVGVRANGDTNMFQGVSLLPWAVYFVVSYYQTGHKRKYLIFSGLITGLQILAGHLQPVFHTLMINGIIIIFYEYHGRKNWISFFSRIATSFILIVAISFLITLPQIYYGFQYMSLSYRWVGAESPIRPGQKVPFHIYAFLYILKPIDYANLLGKNISRPIDGDSIYMGVLPLFLLITYLIKCRYMALSSEYKDLTKLMVIISAVAIPITLGYLTFGSAIMWYIPLVNAIREPARYCLLLNFSFAIIAGLAIANIGLLGKALFENSPKTKFYILLFLAVNGVWLLIFQRKMIDPNVSIPFLCAFLFFLLLKTFPKNSLIYAAFLIVLFIDLRLNKADFWPIDSNYPTTFFQRTRIIDFLEKSYGKYRVSYEISNEDSSRPNIGDVYKIQTRLGFDATMNLNYFDFVGTGWDPHSETYDLLNVKYLVSDKLLDSGFTFLDSLPKTYLYERKSYYPRCYWKSQLGKSGKDIETENASNIRQLSYSDMYQKLEVNCERSDTLVFSENYYPGWKCYDNGKQIPIYMPTIKNYPPLFRAISLSEGKHTIEFKFARLFQWSKP